MSAARVPGRARLTVRLVLGVSARYAGAAGAPAAAGALAPNVFVSIDPDGLVSIVCHRSEMGQGVRTAMPMIVADELEPTGRA